VRRRSLAQISAAIGQSLDFLSTSVRDAEPRHRSMRAVFETSWQLLDAAEQTVLAALAVFPASFAAEAAAAVAGATLADLDLLCEKSLLQQQPEQERYSLHSLLRQFAAEKLATRTPDIERAFVDYFYQFACVQRADYAALQPEWASFAAAIRQAHGLAAWQTVLDFVQVLDEPWFRQIRFGEMRAGLVLALEAAAALEDQPALARTLLQLGEVEVEQNDYGAAEVHLADALSRFLHLEEGLGIAQAKYLLGRIQSEQGQDKAAFKLFEESLHIFSLCQDAHGMARNLNLMASCHTTTNAQLPTALTYLQQSLLLQQSLPWSTTYVEALRYLARVKNKLGEYGDAENALLEAAAISRKQQDMGEYAAVLYEQMVLYKQRTQVDSALQVGYECLAYFQKLGSLRWEALVKTQLGVLQQAKKQPHQALPLFQESLQIFGEIGDLFEQAYAHYYLYQLYAELGEVAPSLAAKQQAQRLALALHLTDLAEKLGQTLP
jgi:tetratricopeptide (TPR) repeat protein